MQHQTLLGDAAKQAGVKLFLPSEFGYPTVGLEEGKGNLGLKSKFGKYLEEIGLPYLRIFVRLAYFVCIRSTVTNVGIINHRLADSLLTFPG
jgi:hypothetical protein